VRRKLGQHFLTDQRTIHRIVRTAHVTAEDTVFEIGPGNGCLTHVLARQARMLVAVEYDAELVQHLQQTFRDVPQVQILHADARCVHYRDLARAYQTPASGIKVVANLPYYAAVPILFTLFEDVALFSECTLMFQKEVADRITASPGTKAYSPLSIAAQYYTTPEYCFAIPPQAFRPPPKVVSAVIKLRCLPRPRVQVHDPIHFFQLVHQAFGSRRKTLKNALTIHGAGQFPASLVETALTRLHLPADIRGERLSLEDFANLSNLLLQIREE
jgi:16S rRNA (adenine1518-N6/adenine1519-N6)-dimethyltransferase